jgi:hypothetical protein
MNSIFVYKRPDHIPHPIPWERLEELKQSKNPEIKTLDEYLWFYYPKDTERLFYEWGDPKEIGRYVAEKALRELEPQLKKALGKVKESQSFGTVVQK